MKVCNIDIWDPVRVSLWGKAKLELSPEIGCRKMQSITVHWCDVGTSHGMVACLGVFHAAAKEEK